MVTAQYAEREQLLLIGGDWRASSSGRVYTVYDPYAGEPVSIASAMDVSEIDAVVEAANDAQTVWGTSPTEARRGILLGAADLLERRAASARVAMREECGSTTAWADFNVELAADMFRGAAAIAGQAQGGRVLPSGSPSTLSLAERVPLGTVLAIAPWNAPLALGARAVAAALACGNTVVFKGSEQCPRTHAMIAAAIEGAGAPPGVIQYVTHHPDESSEITERLVQHPGIAHVNFTGSTRVGRIIATAAARTLKPTLLELGGKAPVVVLDDADLDAAVAAISFGAFMNAGQICMATERAIVHRSLVEQFVRRLVDRAEALVVGDPAVDTTDIGPLVDEFSRDRVLRFIDDARAKGADVVAGGTPVGNCLRPTVVVNVTDRMALYFEESFAPVVAVVPFDDDKEAIRLANDSVYGLAAAVFGRNEQRAFRIASHIDSGIVHINSATVQDEPNAPFGGVKASGWGRFGGQYAIAEFTRTRWITKQSGGGRAYPI